MTATTRARGFDFHCHLDLYPDPAAMVAACERNEIVTLAVTTTPKAWRQNREWASDSCYVHAAVGLHPEVVGERHHELPLLESYIRESRLVGEIGLDGSQQHRQNWTRQLEVFTRALAASQDLGGRVVSIHSRRAAAEVLKYIEQYTTQDRVLPILHWFSGSAAQARKGVDLGCYFSINGCSLQSDTGSALIARLPENRLLTETDGPFAAAGDRPSEPGDVVNTVARLADARGVGVDEMTHILTANAQRVLLFAGVSLGTGEATSGTAPAGTPGSR